MLEQVNVFYEGWGERWQWGTLVSTTALTGRPLIVFEYSNQARQRGLELSSYTLPLEGTQLRKNFPDHQLYLPGPVYDSLPDGWGMLLMDRMFRRRGLTTARTGSLERLAYIGRNAMGAMTFEPVAPEGQESEVHIPLEQLAAQVQEVLHGDGGEFLQTLLLVGGSPQGARPKALVYRDPATGGFTTAVTPGFEAWLIKFPAKEEHAEVCAIEMVYAECLRMCGIETRAQMLRLAEEAEVPPDAAGRVIDGICDVASRFATIAESLYPQVIARDTLRTIQDRIDQNVARLEHGPAGSGHR